MKLKTIAVAAVLLASPVHAEEKKSPREICSVYAEFGEAVMSARQSGVPMAKALEIADDSELLTGIVMQAYDRPRYSTESIQQRTITEFANSQMNACMKVMLKQ